MQPTKESPIFSKMFDLVAWIIPTTTKFPREQRFILATAVQRVTLAAQEALIRAVQAKAPTDSTAHLDEAATQLALLRFYVRLCVQLSLLTPHQYEYLADGLSEIGKLLTGWRRRLSTPAATRTPEA